MNAGLFVVRAREYCCFSSGEVTLVSKDNVIAFLKISYGWIMRLYNKTVSFPLRELHIKIRMNNKKR